MIVKRYSDGGQGHTQNSIRVFFRAVEKILRWENSSARPVTVVLDSNGLNKPKQRAAFTMRIEFSLEHHLPVDRTYVIQLSGTQCGYGGEGPHGTAAILRSMGVPENIVKQVFERKKLTIDWDPNNDRWQLLGPF